MPRLNIRTPAGASRSVDVPHYDVTLSFVAEKVVEVYHTAAVNRAPTIRFVARGQALDNSKTLSQLGLDESSSILVAESYPSAPAAAAPVPTVHVSSSDEDTDGDGDEDDWYEGADADGDADGDGDGEDSTDVQVTSQHTNVYNGEQLRQAIRGDYGTLFHVLHLIAQGNPFFLSYLAVNPKLAREHLEQSLDSPEFKMRVICGDETQDPILPHLTHPLGPNHYEVDEANIRHIQSLVDSIVDHDRVKEMYLMHDRCIPATIQALTDGNTMIHRAP